MTREERHIAVLNRLLENMDVYDSIQPTTERKKAIKAAIKALENHDTFMKYAYSQGKHDALSQEPCDDAISREDALMCLTGMFKLPLNYNPEDLIALFSKRIKALPSVTQKSGKWIGIDEEPHEDYECSCCGYVVSTFTANIEPHTEYKHCPSCGAKMESEDKE